MRLRLLICLMTLLLVATSSWSAELKGECTIRFFGDSTLHGFEGKAACEPFSWTLQQNGEDAATLVHEALIRVPVAGMDTDNDKRDAKMYAMFEEEKFPLIEGHFGTFNPQRMLSELRTEAGKSAPLPFELKIRDQSRSVEANVSELKIGTGTISFAATFPVSLADYQLKAPSVLGFIRVADEVRVEVLVTLRHDNLPALSADTTN